MVKIMRKLSTNATECLETIDKSLEILKVVETLDHDGYDMYGPKSNLWELFVLYKKNNTVCVFVYNREDWFDSKPKDYRQVYNVEYDILVKKLRKTSLEETILDMF